MVVAWGRKIACYEGVATGRGKQKEFDQMTFTGTQPLGYFFSGPIKNLTNNKPRAPFSLPPPGPNFTFCCFPNNP